MSTTMHRSGPATWDLLADALRTIERLRGRLEAGRDHWLDEPVAIVGMGCRLPGGCDTPEAYWHMLRNGVDATAEFPAERADAQAVYDPDPEAPGKAYTIRGGFLDRVDRFEPEVFGISPREALGMDPQQRILLEVCWEALERAGYAPDRLQNSRTGVYIGVSTTDYVRLRQQIGDIADVDAYQLLGEPSFTAGRISYLFGLRGPSKVIDTSCSSSLVAVHEGCQALRLRECDMALCGGVNLLLAPYGFVLTSKFGALSADGRCKTFDAGADGYARGEGAGVVLLKRLRDAQADGDPIVAVVRGSAVNHDGRSSGLTVPNPAAQQDVIQAALAQARVHPRDVDYVEAHGTGTALGDPIELRALETVLGSRRAPGQPLLVGSVKTNIGHLEPAAGIAGLLKVALAIQHGEVPPSLHFTNPNPNVAWDRIHVEVAATRRPWPRRDGSRIGAVSSFGASGTNAHAVLSAPPPPARPVDRPARRHGLFLASTRTEQALRELAGRHARWLRTAEEPALADVCFTTQVGRTSQRHGLSIVASTVDEIADALTGFADRGTGVSTGVLPPHRDRGLAWLFTGQGAQYPGMGAGLMDEPSFRAAFDRCAELLDPALPRPLRHVMWPEGGVDVPLHDTRYTQPALFALEYSLAQLWQSWGLAPVALAGHSVGEIVAACVAGVFDLPDAAALVAARARLMAQLPAGGAMAAVFCDEDTARAAISAHPDTLALAAVNAPAEVVVSGVQEHVAAVLATLREQGVRGHRLTVSHAFHSPLIEPMLADFEAVLSRLTFAEPRIPLVANLTGTWWTAAETGPRYWLRQAAGAVRFRDGMRAMHEAGLRTYVELGPAPVLSALGARCLSDPACVFIPSLRRGSDDRRAVLNALGAVCLRGNRPDWAAVHADEDVRRVALPTNPWRGASYWFREVDDRRQPPARTPASETPAAVRAGTVPGVGHRLHAAVPTYELQPDPADWASSAGTGPDGTRYLPAGALVEIAMTAAADCLGGRWAGAADLTVEQPVPLSGAGAGRSVQLSVSRAADGSTAACEYFGLGTVEEAAGAPWRRHARVVLRRRSGSPDDVGATVHSGAPRVPVEPTAGGPGWADLLAAAVAARGPDGSQWVTGCAEAWCTDPARVRWVRTVEPAEGTDAVEFLAEDGARLGMVRGLAVADPAADLAAPWRDPAELLYELAWQPVVEAPDGSAAACAGLGYLLIADRTGLAGSLAATLRGLGAQVVVAGPPVAGVAEECRPDAEQLDRLLDTWSAGSARCAGIVVLTGADAPTPEHADARVLDEYAARADLTVVTLIQRLTARGDLPGVTVTVVTRGAVAAGTTTAPVNPTAGTLWGLGRVIALEHPERWNGIVDLQPAGGPDESRRLVSAMLAGGTEDQQAVRDGQRWAARLVPGPLPAEDLRRHPVVRPDGSYLITGGLGGIGIALAEWLAAAGAGRLVLLARPPLPPRADWDGELPPPVRQRVDAVRRLERLGAAVDVVAGDVTDECAMIRQFAALDAGPVPLRGVIHAAGVSEPQYVRDATAAAYRRVWRPKVIGGWLMHQLSFTAELDFFVGFSSIAATWGSQHLASYAAGNAFLTGLAHHRRAKEQPALAVDWGPWDTASNLFGAEVMSFLKATGLRPLAAPQCLRLLGALLADGRPHHVVCAVDWSVFKPVMEARTARPMLAAIEPADDGHPDEGRADLVAELLARSGQPGAVAAWLTGYLRTALADVLGTDPAGIDEAEDVLALGLDSLMVMDLVRRCRRELGVTARASNFFDRPTVAAWATFLAAEFGRAHAAGGADSAPLPSQVRPAPGDAGSRPADPPPSGAGLVGAGPVDAGPVDASWIAHDTSLDEAIRASGPPAPRPAQPGRILLTGATGFIGAYLLRELLATTPATIHCLVRCTAEADGLARVRANAERYLTWPEDAERRLVIVPGDLGRPLLGLDPQRFDDLAHQLDAIYHNGAWVNFSYTYQQLKPANVVGTETILRLACQGPTTGVHHVSTYGIWGIPAEDRTVIGEREDIAGAGRLVTGYVQTKWAAERLIQLARERGVPVDVYRPGRVLGDSRTGASLTSHFTTRVIKGCIQLGMAPDIDLDVEMTPVDFVASALVRISRTDLPFGGTYHLVNGRKLAFRELIGSVTRHGWRVPLVPVDRWWTALRDSYAGQPNELHPVMEVVEAFVVGGEEAISYDVTHAEEALRGSGITCPPLDERLLDTYLRWMVRTGYLPPPDTARDH